MVIASLLYIISAYERFHRNALLLDSGGNLYSHIPSRKQVFIVLNSACYFEC